VYPPAENWCSYGTDCGNPDRVSRLVTFVIERIQSNSTCEWIMNIYVSYINVYKIRYVARRRTFAQLASEAFETNRRQTHERSPLRFRLACRSGGCCSKDTRAQATSLTFPRRNNSISARPLVEPVDRDKSLLLDKLTRKQFTRLQLHLATSFCNPSCLDFGRRLRVSCIHGHHARAYIIGVCMGGCDALSSHRSLHDPNAEAIERYRG
jgi:hypothetical protein